MIQKTSVDSHIKPKMICNPEFDVFARNWILICPPIATFTHQSPEISPQITSGFFLWLRLAHLQMNPKFYVKILNLTSSPRKSLPRGGTAPFPPGYAAVYRRSLRTPPLLQMSHQRGGFLIQGGFLKQNSTDLGVSGTQNVSKLLQNSSFSKIQWWCTQS